ncbi:MAG: hypothetical protein RL062_644 [Bacteroidota bacterium]|jgi:hypothetical protein
MVIVLLSCSGDPRKGQWLSNQIIVHQHDLVAIYNRWDIGFSDTTSFRVLSEKDDSVQLIAKRFMQVLDTLSPIDGDSSFIEASQVWLRQVNDSLLPLYQRKTALFKMMFVRNAPSDQSEFREINIKMETVKSRLNQQMEEDQKEFSEDYNLTFSTP